MKIENISTLKINQLTQEQYERLKAEDEIKDNELYFTPASPTGGDIDVTEYAYSKSETYNKTEVDGKIPTELSKLSGDSTHRTVTDTEKSTWSGKQDKLEFDGTYNASSNKAATVQSVINKVAEIVAGAPEDFDTLKEMSDWLATHGTEAAKMNSDIKKNTEDISKKLNANGWATNEEGVYKTVGNKYIHYGATGISWADDGDGLTGKLTFPRETGVLALLDEILKRFDEDRWKLTSKQARYFNNGEYVTYGTKSISYSDDITQTSGNLTFPNGNGTIALVEQLAETDIIKSILSRLTALENK